MRRCPIIRHRGYRELLIAREGIATPQPLIDPDGNRVSLVRKGMFGIGRIGIRLGVRDVEAHRRFDMEALGLPQGESDGEGAMSFLAGDTVLIVEPALDAPQMHPWKAKAGVTSRFRCSRSIASMLTCWPMAAAKRAPR